MKQISMSSLSARFSGLLPKKATGGSGEGSRKARGDKIKLLLSKISGSFMLPISAMAIGGLFLGIGAAIQSGAGGNESVALLGGFIKSLGDPIFGAMPILFAAAFVVAFTEDAGVGVFATIIAFLVFLAIQSVFINPVHQDSYSIVEIKNNAEIPVDGKISTLTKETLEKLGANTHFVMGTSSYVLNPASANDNTMHVWENTYKNAQLTPVDKGTVDSFISNLSTTSGSTSSSSISTSATSNFYWLTSNTEIGYTVLFGGAGRDPVALKSLIGLNMGINSLSTSIFGGIIVGLVMAKLYNKYHTIELPAMIAFFGGKRFVALVGIVAMIPLAILFLIFWPWIGIFLNIFGQATGKIPYGFDSFIFGYIERSLIPFGLHHVFYAPLWWTGAGGDGLSQLQTFTSQGNTLTGQSAGLLAAMQANPGRWVGDSYMAINAGGLSYNNITWNDSSSVNHSLPVFEFFKNKLDLNLGRFLQGKYPFMQWGLPAAAVAMVMAAPKENRKLAIGTVIPAAFTSFLTGVTEPIEFTFLFLSPFLFWGFHAFMAALSFLLMNVLNAHIGMTFSGGFIDLVIYGMVPVMKGTHFWWWAVIGVFYAPIYFFFFWWWIRFRNLSTPGRGGNVKLFTKADYKAKNAGKEITNAAVDGQIDQEVAAFLDGFGGIENIVNYNNCASRLRYDVKDRSKVDETKLKAAGVVALRWVGEKHVQAIIGQRAESLNTKIKQTVNKK